MALNLGTLVAQLRVDNDMRRGLAGARRDLDGFRRDAIGRLRDLRNRFTSEGRAAGDGFGRAFLRSSVGHLRDLRNRFGREGEEGGRGLGAALERGWRAARGRLGQAFSSLGNLAKKGIGGIGAAFGKVWDLLGGFGKRLQSLGEGLGKFFEGPHGALIKLGAVLTGLPIIAGTAASAITIGLGGAIAALGIKAASSAKSVKDAFSDLKDHVVGRLRDLAAPFEPALIGIAKTLGTAFDSLAPSLGRAFASMAPVVERFVSNVAAGLSKWGPMIDGVSAKFGPLLSVLGSELQVMLQHLAYDFSALADAADPRFLSMLISGFTALIDVTAYTIASLAKVGSGIAWLVDKIPGIDFDRPAVSALDLGTAFVKTAAGARDVSESVKKADEAVKEITDALAAYFDPSLAVFNANTQLKQSFQSLAESLKKSKGNMEGNSAAALQAAQDFSGALTSVTDMYQATTRLEGGSEKARATLQKQLPVLYALAGQNKEAKEQVDNLAKTFGLMPGAVLPSEKAFLKVADAMGFGEAEAKKLYKQLDRRPQLKADISDLQSKLKTAKDQLDKVPKEKRPKLRADIADLQKKLREAKTELDRLQGKTITVTVKRGYIGGASAADVKRKAGGGLVTGPGTGTSDSIPTMLSNGEYVLSAAATRRIGVRTLDRINRGTPGVRGTRSGGPVVGTTWSHDLGPGVGGTGSSRSSLAAEIAAAHRKLMAQLEAQVKTLKAGLARIREAREDLLEGLTSMSSDTVKSTAASLSKMVRDAFAGIKGLAGLDNRLQAQIKGTSARLQVLADERAKINERLQEALQFRDTVTGQAMSSASILGITVEDADGNQVDPNASELKTGLQNRLATLRKFAGDIKQLAAQGLSKTVLRQLMESGPEEAGALASAIAQGGQQAVNEITSVQNEIDAEAKNLGEFSADHLYDAGAKAGRGFLTGLTGQLDELQATMETLATNLITTVTNAVAAAEKAAKEKLDKVAKLGEAAGEGKGGRGSGPQEDTAGPSGSSSIRRPGAAVNGVIGTHNAAPKAAVNIENYHEAPGGNARRTGEELLILTRARG